MHHFQHLDHFQVSTEMPSSSATEGNTNGTEGNNNANSQLGAVDMTSRCTIRISRSHNKDMRQHQEAHTVTLVAAARAYNGRTGRPPLATGRCLQSEFRVFAFEAERRYLQKGNLEKATLTEVIKAFGELHPIAPPSLKSNMTRGEWIQAVQAGRNPTYRGMGDEWNRLRLSGEPFFRQNGVKYARENLYLRWQQLLEYE
jgi:hypothetical protein